MGLFYDSISDELDQIDSSTFGGEGGEGAIVAPRAAGSLLVGPEEHPGLKTIIGADFGTDYDTNASVVKQVQASINAAGYSPLLTVDGAYGPATRAGVQWFQAKHGLAQDGIIGDGVLKALGIKPGAPVNWLTPIASPPIAGLAQPVVNAFPSFSIKYEGYTPYMYSDSKGYVTTGIGNLIDPIGSALGLPWKRPDGSLASQQEIIDAWNTVKQAYPGVQSTASQSLTSLRLDKDGIAKLVHGKMSANQGVLSSRYPGIAKLPADSQLALHSYSWAWGPAFSRVWGALGQQFDAAINAQPHPDFITAASVAQQASLHEESINPGIIARDAANMLMFQNAAKVIAGKGKTDTLSFPLDYVSRHPLRTAGIVTGVLLVVGIAIHTVFGKT